MNINQDANALNINEKQLRFEQVAAIVEMSGLEVDASVKSLLQPYIDGKETLEQAVERLQNLLAEVQ